MSNILLFLILGYAVVLAGFYFLQEKFLFFPGNTPFGECPEMKRYNATAEQIGKIRYYLKLVSEPESLMVVFHGNAGNACERTYFFNLLRPHRSNIVLFEYPGYGKDLSPPAESVILDQAYSLIEHLKENNTAGLPIYLVGESLGTGVATYVASRIKIEGLILVSAYTSIADVAKKHYPWLPVNLLLRHKFHADLWAGKTSSPAILFHGTEDDIIPIRFAHSQVQNFTGENRLVEIPGCGHNDILDLGEQIITKEISSFISKN